MQKWKEKKILFEIQFNSILNYTTKNHYKEQNCTDIIINKKKLFEIITKDF